MEDARELSAFRQMRADVQAEYEAAVRTMAELKAQGKEKTVTFRTAFAAPWATCWTDMSGTDCKR